MLVLYTIQKSLNNDINNYQILVCEQIIKGYHLNALKNVCQFFTRL